MHRFKTTDNGGLPFKLDDNRWQDNAYRDAFKGIISAFGVDLSTTILLSGCARTETGGTVTIASGYVSIGGEICYVPSHSYPSPGTQKEYWVIHSSFDNSGTKLFQNLSTHDTYEMRIGKVLVASSVPTGFTKYQLTQSIFDVINQKVDTVPLGAVFLWSGSVTNIPTGYALCDGTNGTYDLRGRFVVGHDPRTTNPSNGIWDANYSTIGATGGEKSHTLTSSELPAHHHPFGVGTASGGVNDPEAIIIPTATQGTHDYDPIDVSASTWNNPGGGAAHNNLPPYFVLAYIMKISTSAPVSPSNPTGVGQSS